MRPDDPRHGTDAGYWTHRRHHKSACRPCRVAHYRANNSAGDAAALTDGRWVARGGIKVWLPDVPPSPVNRIVELTLSSEAMRRGYSQYVQGARTPFAITAMREYQRLHK